MRPRIFSIKRLTLFINTIAIDLFSKGLDIAVRQIVDIINGNNTYREPTQMFSNMITIKEIHIFRQDKKGQGINQNIFYE